MSRRPRRRVILDISILSLAFATVMSIFPRDGDMIELGRPLLVFDLQPIRPGGVVGAEWFDDLENMWRSGIFGPNGAIGDDGGMLFHVSYGQFMAVYPASAVAHLLLAAIVTAMAFAVRRAVASGKRIKGHQYCSSCGYDLEGNPSGRCPECGCACPPDDRREQP